MQTTKPETAQQRPTGARMALLMLLYFIKIGAFTFGSGWSIIAQMEREFVDERGWMTKSDLLELIAVGKSLPGIMVANITLLFGYQMAGVLGGICAAIGLKSAPVGYAPAGWKAKADDPKLAATQLESLTPGQAFRTRGYWHLFLGYGLFPTMYIICYPRFSVLISDAGYSLNAATIGVSIYSICNVIGRFGMGALIDKLGYRKVYTICGICSVASSLCLMFAHSLAMFYIAYVLLAVGFGATNCCHPVAVQETYGSKYAGGIFGICMLGYMIICTFISPKISSALVKATGSYTASMIYAIIACIIAVAVYTTIPMPKRRTLAEVAAEEKAAQEKAAQA